MIFVTDASGGTIHAGREWTTLTGQSVKDALGLGWLSRVHPDDQPVVRETFAAAVSSASEFSLRYRVFRPDDSLCWVVVGCVPSIGPPDVTFLGYLGSLTELADGSADGMTAYGNVGRFVPPPTNDVTAPQDHLDRIADHLIMANALIVADGTQAALPGLRLALFEVGRALAARSKQRKSLNS